MYFYGVDIHTVVVRNTPFIDLLFSEITAVLKFDILPIQNLFTFNKCNKSCSCLVIDLSFHLFSHYKGENKMECQLGLTPRGILSIKDKEKRTIFAW